MTKMTCSPKKEGEHNVENIMLVLVGASCVQSALARFAT